MTGIQVQYWQNVENARSHRANEYLSYLDLVENRRHNKRSEDINEMNALTNRLNYIEANRANLTNEAINLGKLQEEIRSHKENESISWFNAFESQRTHQANEAISWFTAYENQRAHMENESIAWSNLELTERDVQTRENAQATREAELIERTQHNLRADSIAAYANQINKMKYDLDYSKWFDEGGLRDTEISKQVSNYASAKQSEAVVSDLNNKQAGTGVYWDTQEWLDYSKIIGNYFSMGTKILN